jgi:hypothetical protein
MSGALFCNDVVAEDDSYLPGIAAVLHLLVLHSLLVAGSVPCVSAPCAALISLRHTLEHAP